MPFFFLFAVEDSERNDGSPEKPHYMSKPLRKILGKKNKKQESDSDWGTGSFHLPWSISEMGAVELWISPWDINISGILIDFYGVFNFTFLEVFIIFKDFLKSIEIISIFQAVSLMDFTF